MARDRWGREETKKIWKTEHDQDSPVFPSREKRKKRRRFAKGHGYYVGSFQLLTAAVKILCRCRFQFCFGLSMPGTTAFLTAAI